jgi:hypothetical protein
VGASAEGDFPESVVVVVRVPVAVDVVVDSHSVSFAAVVFGVSRAELVSGLSAVVVVTVVVTTGVQPLSPWASVERGPPRTAAVRPPPASADTRVRHARRRALMFGGVRRGRSFFGRPMIVVGADTHARGIRPVGIHIGTQSSIRKGIVTAVAACLPTWPLSDRGNHTAGNAASCG